MAAATGGSTQFFLGTDSAPHAKGAKENACGCAGCFSAHAALPLYAHVFEEVRCPHRRRRSPTPRLPKPVVLSTHVTYHHRTRNTTRRSPASMHDSSLAAWPHSPSSITHNHTAYACD